MIERTGSLDSIIYSDLATASRTIYDGRSSYTVPFSSFLLHAGQATAGPALGGGGADCERRSRRREGLGHSEAFWPNVRACKEGRVNDLQKSQ